MNPMGMLKLKPLFQTFCQDHPKLLMFFSAAGDRVDMDSIIEVKVTDSQGHAMKTNMKVNANDLEFIAELRKVLGR